jgi:hypothetical protein
MLFTGYIVNAQSEIIGKWKNVETGSVIEIDKQNNMFYGEIIKVSGNESKEKVGNLLLNNLIYNKLSNKYFGEVKSTNGITANCEIKMLNQNRFQLTVAKLFIKKTQIFERTE